MIDAALCDQGVTEPRLAALFENLGSQGACALTIAWLDSDQRYFGQGLRQNGWKLWMAQDFSEYNRDHQHLGVPERPVQHGRVFAWISFKERDPGAGISRDHRSVFNSATVLEKRTLPLS